jgi:hypothetical protein
VTMFRPLILLGACALTPVMPVHAQAQAATTTTTIDPARLAAARPVVEKFLPEGTYKRLMGDTMSRMMDGLLGSAMKMPVRQIASISGLAPEKLAQLSDASIEQVTAIVDPHFKERSKRGMDAMFGAMADMMDSFEPRVRDALTRAYARKFEASQLVEIDRFFQTPTGGKFAAEYMSMFMDPEIMTEMVGLMPEMMKKMPDMVKKAEEATAKLPKARSFSDLTKSEREKLATLLGVEPGDLKPSNDNDESDEGTAL